VETLDLLGPENCIRQLIAADRPIIYAVDSLDEAANLPNKHREVRALLKAFTQLNKFATSVGLLCFPLGVVFTVREDFWREWESLFEGAPANTFLKRFSFFNPEQTLLALKRYSDAYGFKLRSSLDKSSLGVLSHPFNMQIFAEANEYRGEVSADRVLDENVLSLYFERKQEDILKRPIAGFTPAILMNILSAIAVAVADRGENALPASVLSEEIGTAAPFLKPFAPDIIRSIASEQIVVRDTELVTRYRFRHMRFIEYLVAFFIAGKLDQARDPRELDRLVSKYVGGDFLSLYYVHEFMSFICRTNYPDTYSSLTEYYSQSTHYVGRLLRMRRSDIAAGSKTSTLDIDVIKGASANADPAVAWDSFFVIAAKNNQQGRD